MIPTAARLVLVRVLTQLPVRVLPTDAAGPCILTRANLRKVLEWFENLD